MSKLVSDLFDIAEFAHHGPENLFISVVKIIGSFIFLFLINARLALPLAIIVLCMFVFSIRQNKKCKKHLWITGERSEMSMQVSRIPLPESVLYNLSQMRK